MSRIWSREPLQSPTFFSSHALVRSYTRLSLGFIPHGWRLSINRALKACRWLLGHKVLPCWVAQCLSCELTAPTELVFTSSVQGNFSVRVTFLIEQVLKINMMLLKGTGVRSLVCAETLLFSCHWLALAGSHKSGSDFWVLLHMLALHKHTHTLKHPRFSHPPHTVYAHLRGDIHNSLLRIPPPQHIHTYTLHTAKHLWTDRQSHTHSSSIPGLIM